MSSITRLHLRSFAKGDRGVALIEFALILPVVIVVLLGVLELTRLALFHQKVDKVVHSMSDFVTQSEGNCIGTNDLDVFAAAADQIMDPFDFEGSIIFSSVTASLTPQAPCIVPNQACISWQYSPVGTAASRIGMPPAFPSMPGSMNVGIGQNVIVTEVTYNYVPLLPVSQRFVSVFSPQNIYRVAVYKPRVGSLTQLTNGSCPST